MKEVLKVTTHPPQDGQIEGYRSFVCLVCGWTYHEAQGVPEAGIAPGTRWENLPPNWVCVECGARQEEFELITE